MRRGIRKTTSTYARNPSGETTTPSAAAGSEPEANAASKDDSQVLETIALQMTTFAEWLSAANRMCVNKALLNAGFVEAKEAIAEGRAAAQADSQASVSLMQQQLNLRPAATSSLKNPGNEAQYVWNCSVLNILTVALTALELNDPVDAKTKLRSAISEIIKRNKHIKIADESAAG